MLGSGQAAADQEDNLKLGDKSNLRFFNGTEYDFRALGSLGPACRQTLFHEGQTRLYHHKSANKM